jgi:hypothetical protein
MIDSTKEILIKALEEELEKMQNEIETKKKGSEE